MSKFNINYLRPTKGRATKTFIFNEHKTEWKLHQNYQAGKYFDGYQYPVSNIKEAYQVISKFQNHPMFMIQGDFVEGISRKNMLRRKRTDRGDGAPATLKDRELSLVCFDVDGFKIDMTGADAIEMFIAELPGAFWEADYIYQYSASYGLTSGNDLKCHLFFWLETPAPNLDVREWIVSHNAEKGWGNIIDPAVLVATQPIYTQRRICSGSVDPIKQFIGFVEKSGPLDYSFPPRPLPPSSPSIAGTKSGSSKAPKYSMQEGIAKILKGESFHHEINKIALSLMGRGMAAAAIKETIKGLMLAAKSNIDGSRLQAWKIRYDDIDRSVDSAFDMVDNPSQEDLLAWLQVAPVERVVKEFPLKSFKKTPAEVKQIIEIVATRSGLDKRELKKRVKGFKERTHNAGVQKKRKDKLLDRKKKQVFEVSINKHNAAEASARVANILRHSKRSPPVFVHGGNLVSVEFERLITIRQVSQQTKKKKAGEKFCRIPMIRNYQKPYHDLIARMGQDIRFTRGELGKEIDCPKELASVVASGRDKDHRELTGIVQAPFVKEDWEIFDQNGYDPQTGLFSIIEEQSHPDLMHHEDAYIYLREEVLAEFPFKAELDATVMIAAMMALLQRPLLAQDPSGMPGFGIVAPVQSSGKTTLVHIATNAILKTSVAASNFSAEDEELSKHILSLLREGHNCVLFDNIAQGTEIKSDTLAKAMSSEVFSGRLLGENKTLKVASAAIWFFTGNNILFSGDFSTRVYPIQLNPKMESPDTRKFKRKNIIDWVLKERPKILAALLSIITHGQKCEPMETGSRFSLWDKYIRAPLYEASKTDDINLAIATNKEHDLDFNNKKKLINAIWEEFQDERFTSRDLITKSFNSQTDKPHNICGELLEDILSKYAQNAKSVGKLLGRMVSRTFGELALTRIDTDRAYWQVEEIKS